MQLVSLGVTFSIPIFLKTWRSLVLSVPREEAMPLENGRTSAVGWSGVGWGWWRQQHTDPLFLAFLLTFLCPALRKAPLWQCQCIPDERKEPGKGFCFSATFFPSLSWLPWSTWYLKPQNGEAVEVFLRDTLYTVSTVHPVLSPVGPSTEFQNPSTHSRPCLNSGQKQKGH